MRKAVVLCCAALLVAGFAAGQEILLDEVVEAGGLQCYPVYGDETSWYYLPSQPHIVMKETGLPEFSFMMYVNPERQGEEGINEAPGGGIVHLVVAYDVPEEMVRRAQRELQRERPGAQLKGPVTYTDGSFALVTSVTDAEAGLSRRVVGVGNAPVTSGHRAAASIHLTPEGAMLLWQSFEQPTPDLSVQFEMTLSGYRNPVEASMVLDFERINQTIEAGVEASYRMVEAEVDLLLSRMVENGSIEVEMKGAPPEQWADIQKLGIDLAKHYLFENLGATPLSELRELRRGSGRRDRRSSLDQLTETIVMVTLPPPDEDEEAAARLAAEAGNLYNVGMYRQALETLREANAEYPHPNLRFNMALCHLRLGEREPGLAALDTYLSTTGVSSPEIDEARQAIDDADLSVFTSSSPDDRRRRGELVERLRDAVRAAAGADPADPVEVTASEEAAAEPRAQDERPAVEEPEGETEAPAPPEEDEIETGEEPSAALESPFFDEPGDGDLRDVELEDSDEPELRRIEPPREDGVPPSDTGRGVEGRSPETEAEDDWRVTVSFRFRRVERSGRIPISLKQWNRIEVPRRFTANVGDMSRWMGDDRVFRRVSLDDPMYKQREIPVSVDVASEEAFGEMLNAVTVTLRKRHESGVSTVDEVTVQRPDIASGAVETLLYGWDGDDDRERWLEYDHRVRWSYVGGPVVETGWQRTSAGALVLMPPLRPRELFLEGDPEVLREQGVRDVVVELRYLAGDVERVAHATVRPQEEVGRRRLVLYQDPQQAEYSYRFDWRLYGGRRVETGPHTDTGDYIYLDEIPR